MNSLKAFLLTRFPHGVPYLPDGMVDAIEEWVRTLVKLEIHKLEEARHRRDHPRS